MDIENLIEQLNDWNEKYISNLCGDRTIKCEEYCIKDDCLIVKAATTLSTLQDENTQLRAELEQKEKYYEQMVDALAATESAELEQVKRALAMMWFAYMNSDNESPHSYETEALEEAERLLGPWEECMPKYLRRGPKED